MMGERMRMGPAEHILSHRTELGLTADQVRQLEAIRDRSAAKNQPHMEEIRKLAAERRAERSAAPRETRRERHEIPPEARAAMDSVRANHQAAREEAAAVLTDAQRSRLQELMPRRGEERQRRMRHSPHTHADSAQVRGA